MKLYYMKQGECSCSWWYYKYGVYANGFIGSGIRLMGVCFEWRK